MRTTYKQEILLAIKANTATQCVQFAHLTNVRHTDAHHPKMKSMKTKDTNGEGDEQRQEELSTN